MVNVCCPSSASAILVFHQRSHLPPDEAYTVALGRNRFLA
jgi:hypothetical protein